ncbi:MAG: bifunctional riboflavin kinase/FAD synthetase [Oscillatoriaceae bacterium SKW80]|nr:bifunctional riboflavin kinase/FAD synthetase [Oscillatoriaceae bacterium SKYG93]MCX8121195.1 bifunctional riboflavin kinase/FAD synthetase [Oscillatoriaceae bacterium SKW80]MDW8453475.1 bifunctional riboflavin kinase/FAD synthetase [Oscillatoriaceae cyanobacterium SKYGB_i_bin93]HIK26825.1 bifunctional riboflavin kinase/FAD synthetase [Oscillatoriaceae cyanobacterium M7585_C2015_266]
MRIISSLETANEPTAIALGNFDGVHKGHKRVIQPILKSQETQAQLAKGGNNTVVKEDWQLPEVKKVPSFGEIKDKWEQEVSKSPLEGITRVTLKGEAVSTVVTFYPHPQEFFTCQPKPKLTVIGEKIELLAAMGVEQLVLLPFDEKMAQLSPHEFVERILVEQLRAIHVSVGANFRFGVKRSGDAEDLRAIAAKYGVKVTIVPLESCQGERISSSAIRAALEKGDVKKANRLLGRSWSLTGTVEAGQQLGKTLGFPTANLRLPEEKFLPRYGVYAVRVWLNQKESDRLSLKGVMNIGCRPTVAGTHPTVEVHILDWSGNLYGQKLTVYLEEFLRPEKKFSSLEALKEQITTDCLTAKTILVAQE